MSTPLTPQPCHLINHQQQQQQQQMSSINNSIFITDSSLDSFNNQSQLTPPNSQSRKRSCPDVDSSFSFSSAPDHIIKHRKISNIASTPIYAHLPPPPNPNPNPVQLINPNLSTSTIYHQLPPNTVSSNYSWDAPRSLPKKDDNSDLSKDASASPSSLITDRKAYAGYLTRQKKECNDAEAASIWSQDVESAFMEALRCIPHVGKRKITVDGRPCGRNELISEYIFRKTGKTRTRKQVSSHIQVLKHLLKDDPEFMELVVENPPNKNSTSSISPVFSKKENKSKKDVFNFSPNLKISKPSLQSDENVILPFNFSMYQINHAPQITRVFSQLIRPQLESPIQQRQAVKLLARFPNIPQITNPKVPIICGKAKFDLPIGDVSIPEGSLFKSDAEFMIQQTEGFDDHWTCVTKVYTLGNEVLSLVESIPTEENLERRSKKLILPFANDFWAAFIVGITGKTGAKSQKEASRAVNAITMTQELYKTKSKDTSLSSDFLYSIIIWEFEMVTDSFSARTVFRKVCLEKELQQAIDFKSSDKRSFSNPTTSLTPVSINTETFMPMHQQMMTYGPIPVMPISSNIPPMMFNNSYYQDSVPLARPLTAFESYNYGNGFHPIDSSNMWYPMNNQGSDLAVKRFVDEKNELSIDAVNAAERAVTLNNIAHASIDSANNTISPSNSVDITPVTNNMENISSPNTFIEISNGSVKSSSPTSPLRVSTPSSASTNYNSNNYLNLQITTPYEPLYVYDTDGNVCPVDLPLKSTPSALIPTPSTTLMFDSYKEDDMIASFEPFHNE